MIPLCQHRLCKNAAEEGKVICSECKESELLPPVPRVGQRLRNLPRHYEDS